MKLLTYTITTSFLYEMFGYRMNIDTVFFKEYFPEIYAKYGKKEMKVVLDLSELSLHFLNRDVADLNLTVPVGTEFFVLNELGYYERVLNFKSEFVLSLDVSVLKEVVWPVVKVMEVTGIEILSDYVGVAKRKEEIRAEANTLLAFFQRYANKVLLSQGIPFPLEMLELDINTYFETGAMLIDLKVVYGSI